MVIYVTKIDYTGKTIGRLTFLEWNHKNKEIIWKVRCQCNNEQWIRAAYVSLMKGKGSIFECSKCKKERKSPTLTDKVFGRLTVIKEVPGKDHHSWWLCKCECGVEKAIPGTRLTTKKKTNKILWMFS